MSNKEKLEVILGVIKTFGTTSVNVSNTLKKYISEH